MSNNSLANEIHELIDDKLQAGVIVRAEWIAMSVRQNHDDIEGEDASFWIEHGYKQIHKIAKDCIAKFKGDEDTPEQLVLPGFKHLCKAYSIKRDDAICLVPVDQCSDQELTDRAEEIRIKGLGCLAHADEIVEYVNARRGAMAG